uniref:Bromo domain-containing protein n=1 Tax=Strongyloides papillosus TaxID=174720 RepID=A0A0N5CAD1_STREA
MGPYEEKENGTYKITRSNNPSEAVTMCNIRELCVANSGDEIAKDAAPEGSKISENDITGVLLGPSPNSTLPENEEEPINVNKRIDETQNNNSNIANNTQTPAVETTTLVQTSSPVVAENSPVQNPSNIPESESEDTTTQTPSNLPQTLSTQPSEILTESGSGVEITTKNNDIQTTVIQSSVESSTSSGNLKNEEAAITTTAAPSNTTIPENLTGSTPTFTTPSNEITTSPVINQETTTSIGVPLNKSAEIDTSTENTNNGQINLNNETITTSTTTVVPGSESKEFDNSNESGDLTTKLQDAPEVSTTATTTISNQIDTQQQQNNTTNNNIPQESPSTTVSIIGEVTNTTTSVNIDTTTIPQTTTLINNNNNQSIPNTSTPETINKFLASHELDNSKENKEIINQINNDNGKTNNCGDSHKDLSICDSYMNEYLNRVETWARQRNDTLDNQLWKACSLLRKVPHVPTLCCHIFNFKCGSHVTRPPTTTTTVSSLV